jgi:hypothetical protein
VTLAAGPSISRVYRDKELDFQEFYSIRYKPIPVLFSIDDGCR